MSKAKVISLFNSIMDDIESEVVINSIEPIVFTPQRMGALKLANDSARVLRSLGFSVLDEDIFPDDNGTPILLIGPSQHTGLLVRASPVHMVNKTTGAQHVRFLGCRVVWIEADAEAEKARVAA